MDTEHDAPAAAAAAPPAAGGPRSPPRSPRAPSGKLGPAAAAAAAAAAATAAAAPPPPPAAASLADAAAAAPGEARGGRLLTLACLCLRLVTTRSHRGARRAAAADGARRAKLLDAVLCAHPQLLKRFLALADVPRALSLLLVRQPEVPVRRQASLLVRHICIDKRRCVADAIRLMQGLLPVAVEHAATSSDYWELFTRLLFAAGEGREAEGVADSEADADAPGGNGVAAAAAWPRRRPS